MIKRSGVGRTVLDGEPNRPAIVIWGAGKIGHAASEYYAGCNILFFIDRDEQKWGTLINGIRVLPPNSLEELDEDVQIVIAINNYLPIVKRLEVEYKKKNVEIFEIDVNRYEPHIYDVDYKNMISIHFGGGLGNQMFQFALYKAMESVGKNVYVNFGEKKKATSSPLLEAFRNVSVRRISDLNEYTFFRQLNIRGNIRSGGRVELYNEEMREGIEKSADTHLLEITSGIINGIFQTRYFANMVRKELLSDFCFKQDREQLLDDIIKEIPKNSVSIHVRRGDYLTGDNLRFYGDICTDNYYNNAISYIRDRIENPVFYFFSNDIEYVREHMKIDGAVYVSEEMFQDYRDWYDMLIMSRCSHNIIANSTFSWWGAWLNRNENKIVIAPSKWINVFNYKDIYPDEWVTMGA